MESLNASDLDYWTARALLEWQVELGADEAIGDQPLNRYELPAKQEAPKPVAAPEPIPEPVQPDTPDPVQIARQLAAGATNLADLAAAMRGFDLCDLKQAARNFVFADGSPEARVMIIAEAPGREEDRTGKPMVGQTGQLLDKMLAAIGLDRDGTTPDQGVYLTGALPWRAPQDRPPGPGEIAMFQPFLERHIALANPDFLVLMGNTPLIALTGKPGITRRRGQWIEVMNRPTLPMLHPKQLLKNPAAKRDAWADLLSLKSRLMQEA